MSVSADDHGQPVGAEPDVGRLRGAEAPQQQPGDDEQDHRQRELADDEHVAQRPAPPADARRLACSPRRSAARRMRRRLQRRRQRGEQAGAQWRRASAKANTRSRAAHRARWCPGSAARSTAAARISVQARAAATARAAHPEHEALAEHLADDLPAAGADRQPHADLARARDDARASSMPATLAQAISSTRPTTAITPADPMDSGPPACGTSIRTSLVANADMRRLRLVSGWAAASCAPMHARRWRAPPRR